MKVCSRCKTEKQDSEFHKDSQKKSGLTSACKPCRSDISAEWYKSNEDLCKELTQKYKKENEEKVKARNKVWASRNRDKLRQASLNWRKRNPAKVKAANARWQEMHPDRSAVKSRNRRARERRAEGTHTKFDVEKIFSMQKGKCAICRSKLITGGPLKYHVDHIYPIALGGSNWPTNLQCLCRDCNQEKHAKDPYEWAKEQGRLL